MRISLFKLVFVIPVFVAIAFGYIALKRNAAISRIEMRVMPNKNLFSRDVEYLISMIGDSGARKALMSLAKENDNLFYDGDTRLAQIVRYTHPSYGESDMLCLITVGHSNGWRGTGPRGLRMNSIDFTDKGLVVDLHGDLEWESFTMPINEKDSLSYPIPWPPGVPCTASRNLGEGIVQRNMNRLEPK